MSEQKRIVGIDLGTTYSVLSYFPSGNTKPIVIKNQEGEDTTPSVVAVGKNKEIIVGTPAKNLYGGKYQDSVVQFIKRHIGEEDYKISIKNVDLNPSEISSYILKKMKTAAEMHFNQTIDDAIITVPAYFTIKQKEATKLAAQLAGLNVIRMINEPTAAAIAYGLGLQDNGKEQYGSEFFLVYDLGGGTMDISIMELIPKSEGNLPVFNVVSINGDHLLGGYDFDMRLTELIIEKICNQHNLEISENDPKTGQLYSTIYKRVFKEAEKLKKQLSAFKEIETEFPFLPSLDGTPINAEITVSRDEYEARIMPLLNRTMDLIEEALVIAKKDISIDDISTILLVGGSSRTPKISEMIEEKFGFAPNIYNPDLCVSYGASILGAVLSGIPITHIEKEIVKKKKTSINTVRKTEDRLSVHDCVSHSLGVEVEGKYHSIIIPRFTEYPVTREKRYSTSSPHQPMVIVRVYQGEDEIAQRNVFLGEFDMKINPRPHHVPIDVRFQIDASGILTVTAFDKEYNQETEITIKGTSTVGITKNEMNQKKMMLDQIQGDTSNPQASSLLDKYSDRFQQVNAMLPSLNEKQKIVIKKKSEQLKQAIIEQDLLKVEQLDEQLLDFIMMLNDGENDSNMEDLSLIYSDFIGEVENKINQLSGVKKELLLKKFDAFKQAINDNDVEESKKMKQVLDEFLMML